RIEDLQEPQAARPVPHRCGPRRYASSGRFTEPDEPDVVGPPPQPPLRQCGAGIGSVENAAGAERTLLGDERNWPGRRSNPCKLAGACPFTITAPVLKSDR